MAALPVPRRQPRSQPASAIWFWTTPTRRTIQKMGHRQERPTALAPVERRGPALGRKPTAVDEWDHEQHTEHHRHGAERTPDVRVDPEQFAATMFMPRVQLIGYVGLKPGPAGSSSVPKSGDDEMSWGAVPGSRGTRIDTSRTIPRMMKLRMSQPLMCSLKAAGSTTRAEPKRDGDALEPDQQVVPPDEQAQERSARSRYARRRSAPASRSRSGWPVGRRRCS